MYSQNSISQSLKRFDTYLETKNPDNNKISRRLFSKRSYDTKKFKEEIVNEIFKRYKSVDNQIHKKNLHPSKTAKVPRKANFS